MKRKYLCRYSCHFIVTTVLILFVGCSHDTPYYKGDGGAFAKVVATDTTEVIQRVIAVGDAGVLKETAPLVENVFHWANVAPSKTTIVFLGDNAYPVGLPDESKAKKRRKAEAALNAQLKMVIQSGAEGIFLPGNHDWGGQANYNHLKEQQLYINEKLGKPSFFPENGCIGPHKLDKKGVRLLFVDTQWWLQKEHYCPEENRETFIQKYSQIMRESNETPTLVLAHHPLRTHGRHGGFYSWKEHLFPLTAISGLKWLWIPLPLVGSLYPLINWHFIRSQQDVNDHYYREMVSEMDSLFAAYKPLAYVSGHDHNLQVNVDVERGVYHLVSGAGSKKKVTPVGHGSDSQFAFAHSGFMVIDFLSTKKVRLTVVAESPSTSSGKVVYIKNLN